ncbi:MAG: helix-turn-helix domain-containing protein [Patescibacteria group bacterium]|jgi:FMN phosphatase YigB (HAD superfamily)/DNA-binding XRE family transcriptional regulator|nr:helix-turn-helix domain-containing protein [Patescibacteria group bacterium]
MISGGTISPEFKLGQRIQDLRKSKGFTQQGLCYKAHLSYSTLAKIERGAIKSPSIFTIQSIANALNLSIDDFVDSKPKSTYDNPPINRNLKVSKDGIRFVYFDVNGCLVRFYQKAFIKIANDYNLGLDKIEASFWNFNDKVNRGNMTIDQFNKKFASKLGIKSIDWVKYYLNEIEPVPGMNSLLHKVYKNYLVGLLSNTMPGMIEKLVQTSKIPNIQYDMIIDSSVLKSVKPESKIFEKARDSVGIKANEIILIDDTRNNLIMAGRLHFHTLWFDYSRPKDSIAEIEELLEI